MENKIAYELDAILEYVSGFIKTVEFKRDARDFEMVDWQMLSDQLDSTISQYFLLHIHRLLPYVLS